MNTLCQGGCGKVRADDPKDWICYECGVKSRRVVDDISKELLPCPECGKAVHSVPAEGVRNQSLRACQDCGAVFIMDLYSKPIYEPHWIAGSGSHGCLYDSCHVYESYQDAVDGLADTFELGRTRKARLFADGNLELNPGKDGAEYCEIVKCTCGDPSTHDDEGSL